jgi:hypothetical protein
MRDRHLPLAAIFSVFASVALVSVFLVLMIRPTEGQPPSDATPPGQP